MQKGHYLIVKQSVMVKLPSIIVTFAQILSNGYQNIAYGLFENQGVELVQLYRSHFSRVVTLLYELLCTTVSFGGKVLKF